MYRKSREFKRIKSRRRNLSRLVGSLRGRAGRYPRGLKPAARLVARLMN